MTQFKTSTDLDITIPMKEDHLDGILHIPQDAKGLVLFVHGSGSSRFSVRNRYVSSFLNQSKLATLLFDLLTPREDSVDEYTREFRFDIDLLTTRLNFATAWCQHELSSHQFKLGYFGASTGGAAALVAAAQNPDLIKAVVSRGGRPDLAGNYLPKVKAPTLLIVGGNDEVVIELNESAQAQMHCLNELKIVPGATHLFEEPGTLEQVAKLAQTWFTRYLSQKIKN